MRTYIVEQTVTNSTFNTICERYAACGWHEKEIKGTTNNITSIVFEWSGEGLPEYPILSDIR